MRTHSNTMTDDGVWRLYFFSKNKDKREERKIPVTAVIAVMRLERTGCRQSIHRKAPPARRRGWLKYETRTSMTMVTVVTISEEWGEGQRS